MPKGVPAAGKRAPWGSVKRAKEEAAKLGLSYTPQPQQGSIAAPPPMPLDVDTGETDEEIYARISKTFKVLNRMISGVIDGRLPSVIISGAPGCGKSYETEFMLTKAANEGRLNKFEIIKGSMSGPGLFQKLWDHRGPKDVLVIDDCDTIFGDYEAINVLKAALDTKRRRIIAWNKEAHWLEAMGIDRKFEFEGSVIFISNLNFPAMIESGTKMSPHYSALVDRSVLIDLGIHTRREVLVRIRQVVYDDAFLNDNGIQIEQAKAAFDWLHTNVAKLRTLSIRTVLQIHQFMKMHDDDEWVDAAEVGLFRRGR